MLQSFILTKWYVNNEFTEDQIVIKIGFILTKWYVNNIQATDTKENINVLY